MKRSVSALTAILASLLLVLTACGGGDEVATDPSASDFGTVRIGKGFSRETEAVAYIYAGILQEAGYQTEVVDSGSSRSDYLAAMSGGSDTAPHITPDYTGNLLLELSDDGQKNPRSSTESPITPLPGQNTASASATPSPTPTGLNVHGMSSSDIVDSVKRVLPDTLTTLTPASAENKDALVVTQATAAKYDLSTIQDLADHCKDLTFGAPTGFQDRSYGTKGLRSLYGCVPGKYRNVDDQEKLVDQLADDSVDVADVFTASASIRDNNFVVLEDPQANFIAQQVVPVVQADVLPDSAKDAVNNASSRLKSGDLVFLDQLMTGDNPVSAQDAAKFWLKEGDG